MQFKNFLRPQYYFHSLSSINKEYPIIAKLLFFLLFLVFLFILLHLYSLTLPLTAKSKMFRLDMDWGYAEIFQYFQLILSSIFLIFLALKTKIKFYFFWALLILCLFLTDAYTLHEDFGGQFARYINAPDIAGLRGQDLGELAMAIFLGLIFVLPIGHSLIRGSDKEREVSVHLIIITGIMIFFGVGIDMLHSILKLLPGSGVITILEDGGELIAGSLYLWYTFYLFLKYIEEAAK